MTALADSHDAKIKAIQLTDVRGTLSLRYLLNDREQLSEGEVSSFEDQDNLELDFFLLASGYGYHPDFLEMQVGAGPVVVTQNFSASAGDNSTDEVLFNFLGDFRFLKNKPYPVRFNFSRSHPSVSTSLAGSFLVERDEVGLNVMLRDPVSPIQLTLDAFHTSSDGSGHGAVLDEDLDEVSLSAFKSYRKADRIRFTYRWNRRDSLSGSSGLPISQTLITTESADIDARNVFGSDGQVVWIQQLSQIFQETERNGLEEFDDRAYFSRVNWAHSRVMRSFYTYRFRQSERPERSDNTIHALRAGLSREYGDHLRATGEVNAERNEDVAFRSDVDGAHLKLNYSRPTTFGSLNLGGTWSYQQTSRVAESDELPAFDEPIVLSGTAPVDLRNDFVVESTVVVRNEPKTQVFIEGVDYRLTTIGSTTSIQRLINGNIADGQTVLVDYAFLSGGSADFNTVTQTYVADVRFLKHLNAFVRFSDRGNDLTGGNPTTPLNDVTSLTFGIGADYPVGDRITVGGEARFTDQEEDIASFDREIYDVYAQMSLTPSSSLLLSANRQIVDNKTSVEDVDLMQYRVQFRSRLWRTTNLTLFGDRLRDTGGTLLRERSSWGLAIRSSYRQLRFTLRAEDVSEKLGSSERGFLQVSAHVVREY